MSHSRTLLYALFAGASALSLDVGHAAAATATDQTQATATVEDIVVVAQKREEALQSVPVAVTAFKQKDLQAMGADSMQDYLRLVPSVSFTSLGPDQTDITIRGLPLITGAPTVGVYIDGISLAANFSNPDPRLFDVRDVEILRGPQGTLYGQGAIGGLILINTNRPDPTRLAATIDVTGSYTDGSNRGNDELNGMINIPIVEDKLALRAVAYQRSYGGFIDQVSTGTGLVGSIASLAPAVPAGPGVLIKHDANTEDVVGGRVSLAYTGTPDLDVVITGSGQQLKTGADQFIMPVTRGLFFPTAAPLSYFNDFATRRDDTYWQLDGQATYDFHWATLTATAGYNNRTIDSDQGFTTNLFIGGVIPEVPGISNSSGHTFQTEVRMVSQTQSPLQWIVGGAYYETVDDIFQTTDITGLGFLRTVDQTSKQYALFGEVSYTLPTIPLTGRVGLRYFDERATLASHVVDPFGVIASTVPDQFGALNSSAVSPRFVLEYRFNPVVMAYGSISRGFRSGGINVDLEPLGFPTPGFQPTFKPDSVWTYELGAKTQWLDHRLQVNGALFYNQWQDLQIDGLPQDPSLGFTTNAGRAHSDGAELEVTAVPIDGLTLTLGGSAIHAVLDEPAMGAPAGARLPNVPNYTFDGSISYERPIAGSYSAFVRLDGSYKGDTFGNLPNIPQSATNPPFVFVFRNQALAYATANLRLGVENHRYSVTFFVENLSNSLASTFHFNDNAVFGVFGLFDEQEYIARPRTFGLEVRATY